MASRAPTSVRESLWLLSTRRLPATADDGQVSFAPEVWQFDTVRGWVSSTLDELLLAGSQSTATNLFIHGNDTAAQNAAEVGGALYQQLRFDAQPAAPRQFVIWSWPSAISGAGVRQSAQINALRTNIEGYYLACYLSRVSSEVPIHLSGYCTGARIATGGLHLLGGGSLAGMQIANSNRPPPHRTRAVLVAAAIPNGWLLPGGPHELALSQLDRLVITVNAVDPVLRWHPLMWGRGGPLALGMTGLPIPLRLDDQQTQIVQLDLTRTLGRRHSWKYYRSTPEVIALLHNEIQNTRVLR